MFFHRNFSCRIVLLPVLNLCSRIHRIHQLWQVHFKGSYHTSKIIGEKLVFLVSNGHTRSILATLLVPHDRFSKYVPIKNKKTDLKHRNCTVCKGKRWTLFVAHGLMTFLRINFGQFIIRGKFIGLLSKSLKVEIIRISLFSSKSRKNWYFQTYLKVESIFHKILRLRWFEVIY